MAFLADGRPLRGPAHFARTSPDPLGTLAWPPPDVARSGPTIAPEAPAPSGHELAVAGGALRVPCVDGDGRLLGVVAVTEDRAGFCG